MFNSYFNYLLCLLISLLICTSVKAETNSGDRSNSILEDINFVPPKDGEKPETKGAGTRDPNYLKCSPEDGETVAIMPDDNYGLTVRERPEIFVYLPQTSAKQVVLSFESQDKKYHEVSFLEIPPSSEVVSFALPENKPGIKPGEYYQWKLTLVCGKIPHVDDPVLSGWVQRKDRDEDTLKTDPYSDTELAQWYGENGYWYDLLGQLRQIEANNLQDGIFSKLWLELIEKY